MSVCVCVLKGESVCVQVCYGRERARDRVCERRERETECVRGDSEKSGVREGARGRVCNRRRLREFARVCVS